MLIPWISFLSLMETVLDMETRSNFLSLNHSILCSTLVTLWGPMDQLQGNLEKVQEFYKDSQEQRGGYDYGTEVRRTSLRHLKMEIERKISLMKTICNSTEIESDKQGEEELTNFIDETSASTDSGPLEPACIRTQYGVLVTGGGEDVKNSLDDTTASRDSGVVLLFGGLPVHPTNTAMSVLGSSNCSISPLPVDVHSCDSVDSNGLYLLCGGHQLKENVTNQNCYTLRGKTWELHSKMIRERSGHSMVSVPGRGIYVFGGYGDDIKSTSEFLPTGSDTWIEGPSIPGDGVSRSCAVLLNTTHILVAGGYNSSQVLVYDVTTDQWSDWPSLPQYVWGPACIRTQDGVLVTGGITLNENRDDIDQTLLIDFTNGQIETVGSLNEKRFGHRLVEFGGRVLVVGGYRVNIIEEWNSSTKSWRILYLNPEARQHFAIMAVTEGQCI